MTNARGTKEKFTVEMTLDQARKAAEVLTQIGVHFEPEEGLTVYDPSDDSYWVMKGQNLERLLAQINEHLEDNHPGLRVPEPETLEAAAEALKLAYWEFEWQKWGISEDLWNDGGKSWDEMAAKYPCLFAQQN